MWLKLNSQYNPSKENTLIIIEPGTYHIGRSLKTGHVLEVRLLSSPNVAEILRNDLRENIDHILQIYPMIGRIVFPTSKALVPDIDGLHTEVYLTDRRQVILDLTNPLEGKIVDVDSSWRTFLNDIWIKAPISIPKGINTLELGRPDQDYHSKPNRKLVGPDPILMLDYKPNKRFSLKHFRRYIGK